MFYDAFIWLCISFAAAQFLIDGDEAAGAVALLLVCIQFARIMRHRRLMAF